MRADAVLLLVDAALLQMTVDLPMGSGAVLLVDDALRQTTADPVKAAPLVVHLTSSAAPDP